MNRKQRRALNKKPKKVNKHDPQKIIDFEKTLRMARNSIMEKTPKKEFEEGSKVRLNLEAIKARKNYIHMSKPYKDFVESNDGTVFTVKLEHGNKSLVTFEEDDKWLFWAGDLIDLNESEEPNKNEEKKEMLNDEGQGEPPD